MYKNYFYCWWTSQDSHNGFTKCQCVNIHYASNCSPPNLPVSKLSYSHLKPARKKCYWKKLYGKLAWVFLVVLKDPYGQFGAYSIWWQILSQIAPNMAKCPLLQLRYIHKRDLHTKKTLRCINVSRCTARNSIKIKQEQKMKFLSNPNALFHTEYTKSIYICS